MASILCWKWSGALRFYHLSLRSIMWGWQCGWFYSLTLCSLYLCLPLSVRCFFWFSAGRSTRVCKSFISSCYWAGLPKRERERERKRKREVWGKKKRKQTSEGNRKKRSRRKRRERERERSDKKENVLSLFFCCWNKCSQSVVTNE